MVELIGNLIGNDFVATGVVSFVPMIELKGGIVFARGLGLDFFLAFALAYLGSTVAFVVAYWLINPILKLLKKIKWFNGFAVKIEDYCQEKAEEALKKGETKAKKPRSATFIKQLAVFIFVAIPLPMTGVWMGTVIAVFLNLKFKETILPVALGNFVAGLIISLLAELFIAIWDIAVLDYVLYGLLGLAIILLVLTVVKICTKKTKAKESITTAVENEKEE